MFTFSFLLLLYSYGIFVLGIFGILTKFNIIFLTIIWFILLVFFERRSVLFLYNEIRQKKFIVKDVYKNPVCLPLVLLILLAVINLMGALGPELAFDSLWYHLTLPKLYLLHHAVYHIPGGLLYYSDMPK